MYQEWPFFQSTMDLIEMILAKADMRIAQLYDEQLVHDPSQRALGATIRERFQATVQAVLQVPTSFTDLSLLSKALSHTTHCALCSLRNSVAGSLQEDLQCKVHYCRHWHEIPAFEV